MRFASSGCFGAHGGSDSQQCRLYFWFSCLVSVLSCTYGHALPMPSVLRFQYFDCMTSITCSWLNVSCCLLLWVSAYRNVILLCNVLRPPAQTNPCQNVFACTSTWAFARAKWTQVHSPDGIQTRRLFPSPYSLPYTCPEDNSHSRKRLAPAPRLPLPLFCFMDVVVST